MDLDDESGLETLREWIEEVRIEIMKKAYLAPDVILRMIINEKDDTLKKIKEQADNIMSFTSTLCFWEVMSCLTEKEIQKYSKKICEVFRAVSVFDFSTAHIIKEPKIQDKKRIANLRKVALL